MHYFFFKKSNQQAYLASRHFLDIALVCLRVMKSKPQLYLEGISLRKAI